MLELDDPLKPIRERLEKTTPKSARDFLSKAPADIAKLLEAVRVMDEALFKIEDVGRDPRPDEIIAREARQKVREVLDGKNSR